MVESYDVVTEENYFKIFRTKDSEGKTNLLVLCRRVQRKIFFLYYVILFIVRVGVNAFFFGFLRKFSYSVKFFHFLRTLCPDILGFNKVHKILFPLMSILIKCPLVFGFIFKLHLYQGDSQRMTDPFNLPSVQAFVLFFPI